MKSISHKKRGNDEFSLIISVFYISDIEQCTDTFLICGVQRELSQRDLDYRSVSIEPDKIKEGNKYR